MLAMRCHCSGTLAAFRKRFIRPLTIPAAATSSNSTPSISSSSNEYNTPTTTSSSCMDQVASEARAELQALLARVLVRRTHRDLQIPTNALSPMPVSLGTAAQPSALSLGTAALPDKTELVIYCGLTQLQMDAYRDVADAAFRYIHSISCF